MTIFDVDFDALTGGSAGSDRCRGSAILVVNVASRCGFDPRTPPDDTGPAAAAEQQLPH
jgi:glutathione peroxidase-family protein